MDLPAQETLFAPYIRDSIPPEPTAEPYTYSVINRHLALRQNEGDEDSSVSSATCAYYSFAGMSGLVAHTWPYHYRWISE